MLLTKLKYNDNVASLVDGQWLTHTHIMSPLLNLYNPRENSLKQEEAPASESLAKKNRLKKKFSPMAWHEQVGLLQG